MEKSITQRIIEALSNTEQKPPLEDLQPVKPGDKVIGVLSPGAQGLFCLLNEIRLEGQAESAAKTGTDACCTTCRCEVFAAQVTHLQDFLGFIVGEELGRPLDLSCDVRAEWNVVETPPNSNEGIFGLPPEFEDLFRDDPRDDSSGMTIVTSVRDRRVRDA